jgi:hypothetical protein
MSDDDYRCYFPVGGLDSRPDLHRGLTEEFALFLRRMGEPPLYPAGPHQPLVVRLLCLPTWSQACAVRVEPHGLTWRLVAKEVSGEAGFEVGQLVRSEARVLSAAEYRQAEELWEYLRFWSLPPAGGEDVLDGTTYLLEAAQHGRYHAAVREDPEWGDTFGEFCESLLRLAGLALR